MTDQAELPGVEFSRLRRHADVRGGFAEAWRMRGSTDAEPFPAVQANLSLSAKGVLRGLHLHRRQWDLWVVVSGVAFVALVDIRPMLEDPAAGPLVRTEVLAKDETVRIPPGVAHGFLAVEATELLYFVTREYDASDELGFAWDDPRAAVEWPSVETPDRRPILSDRDRSNPALESLVLTLRRTATA
jgi:dTDP-4-dehydrorhamnose 3,5-epimerase